MLSSPEQEISRELLALCQSQLTLLAQSLNAQQAVVYFTQKSLPDQSPQLVPVATYPVNASHLLAGFSTTLQDYASDNLPSQSSQLLSPITQKDHQLVVPLVYEETVIGLLVTKRENLDWQSSEIDQVEKIAETISIATLLHKRQTWSQQKFQELQQVRMLEQEKLDDFLHQLRNPLTALQTFAKLLLKKLLPGDSNRRFVSSFLRETEHIQDLVTEFSRDTSPLVETSASPKRLSGETLSVYPVSILSVIEPILASAEAIAQDQNITLEVDLPQNLPPVLANPQALREVMQNLLDNALKYTPPQGKIRISTLSQPQKQGVAIADTGYGIPPEVQSHIFERHYRGIQADSDIPGTGLGLAIAQTLMTQMQGSIDLFSPNHQLFYPEINQAGTTFVLWLPLSP